MSSYYQDVLAAHDDCGLLLREGLDGDFAFAYPALAPWKVREGGREGGRAGGPAVPDWRRESDTLQCGSLPACPCAASTTPPESE